MNSSGQPSGQCNTDFQVDAQGHGKLAMAGRLNLSSTPECWRQLQARLAKQRLTSLTVDVSQLELEGGVGVALLRFVAEGGMTPGTSVEILGLSDDQRRILETFTAEDFRSYEPAPRVGGNIIGEVGGAARSLWQDVRAQVGFIGILIRLLPGAVLHPKRLRWQEIKRVAESAGANALPVIAVFSWLVGLVLALEAARPLEQFGAQMYIADMVGFSSIRDTGPLVTAIMLAGRSGSAFAAELGTMKVNQELDALTTMGLNPVRFLVIQRVAATVLLAPVLTGYAMLMGILGGITVLRFLGFPPLLIYHQIVGRIHMNDLFIGLVKSVIFGLIVGGMGCLRGLQTTQGPRAVGESTTRAVVASILLVVVADSLVSTAAYFLSL